MKKKVGKAKTAKKKVKDLPAKTLSARSARSVKGGHRKAGKGQQEYLVVKMNDVLIT